MAENMLITMPKERVRAKPCTKEEPNQNRIIATNKVVRFPSRIDGHARVNPSSMATIKFLPARSSSLMREKMSTFASTAIPTDKITPAIPANVRVTGITLNNARRSTRYKRRAKHAKSPGTLYTKTMNKTTARNPMTPAFKLFTKEFDTVLDPFMGSGTTIQAAKDLKRNSVGIDILPEYYKMVKRQIQEKEFVLF